MLIKTSHFVAEIDGKSVYATSHSVHVPAAYLCCVYGQDGRLLTTFINALDKPINTFGYKLKTYPATKLWTDAKREHLRRQYTGGVDDDALLD